MTTKKLASGGLDSGDKSDILEDISLDDIPSDDSGKKFMIFESTANGLLAMTIDAAPESTKTP
jgi:hypothetical protein